MPDETVREPKPKRTIQINETIQNAPMDEDVDTIIADKGGGGGKRAKKPPMVEDDAEGEDDFHKFLQDGTCKVHVDRVSPREWKGKQISGMIDEYVTPTSQDEIETDLRNRFGGGRYRIRVIKNGRFIAARGVSVYGDPKIEAPEEEEDDGFEFDRVPPGFRDVPPGPPMMNDEITQLRLQIEKEKLKNSLEEVKSTNAPKHVGIDPEKIARDAEERIRREMDIKNDIRSIKDETNLKLTEFMSGIEKVLRSQKETDPGRQSDIVALDNKIERIKTDVSAEIKSNFSEIRALLSNANKPEKPDNMPQMMQAIMSTFAQMAQGNDAKIQAMMQAESVKSHAQMEMMKAINDANAKVATAQTEKLVAVLQTKGNDGGISKVAETISAVRDIAESMGMSNGGNAAAEDAEPQDLTTRFMGVIEKAVPTVLAAIKQKSDQAQNQGRPLTDQEIRAIYQQEAQRQAKLVAPQVAAQILQRQQAMQQGQNPPGLPSPKVVLPPQQQPVQQKVTAGIPMGPQPVNLETTPHQITTGPTLMPPAPPAQPLQIVTQHPETGERVVVAEVPQAQQQVSQSTDPVQVEKANIVNECMKNLLREIRVRPRAQSWNEYAFDNLPDDVLEKLAVATNVEEVLAAIAEYARPEFIEQLKAVFQTEPRSIDWLVDGLNELKEWYVEEDQAEEATEEPAQ